MIDGREVDLRAASSTCWARCSLSGPDPPRQQLLGLVWGADDITPKTVDVHVARFAGSSARR